MIWNGLYSKGYMYLNQNQFNQYKLLGQYLHAFVVSVFNLDCTFLVPTS